MHEHPYFDLLPIDGRSIVQLRVRPQTANAACKALQLPQHPQQWRGTNLLAHWLGPDQWLITSDKKPVQDIIDHIDEALAGTLYAATDMSSNYACLELSGPAARTILAMGCAIDIHRSVFMPGHCTRTHFANVLIHIAVVGDDTFDLYVDRSLAGYLEDWLVNAGEDPLTHDLKYVPGKLSNTQNSTIKTAVNQAAQREFS